MPKEIKAFLEYMNGQKASTSFTEEIEKQVSRTREDEKFRREYMLITSFEMDTRRTGIQEGLKQGIKQGVRQGDYGRLVKTIANMRQEHLDNTTIARVTGLSLENLKNF